MGKNIAITESYLQSVFKLDNQSKRLTLNTIKQLSENPRSTSLQIHSIDRQKCDSKFRSARVNVDLRIIFIMQGDTFTLLYVDHHDAAYDWCDGKFLAKTDFGAQYIYDEKAMLEAESNVPTAEKLFSFTEEPLLKKAEIKEKQIVKLGIPSVHAKNLISISNEDAFIDYIAIFPTELQEGLLDLATGVKSFDSVYNELVDTDFNETTEPLKQKDSKRRFYITESIEELDSLMENEDFESWTLFLHPSQEKIVKRNFNGPALIEGGPGTGKTIVGIHRAVYLSEHVYKASDNKKILFCTFSKKLAKVIDEKLNNLMKQKCVTNNVDVVSIDSFIYNNLKKANRSTPPVNMAGFSKLLNNLYDRYKPKGTKGFYEFEYFEVIEKNNIKSLDEYLIVDRTGTGLPLSKKGRETAWKFIELLLNEKKKANIVTFVDRAYLMLNCLQNGEINAEYDSIIIDEAQDLEPVKLKALCKCVRTESNNIMVLSDMNQRIFKLTTWKNDGGINVVGRTFHLSLNYRTTKQINDYARYQFINSEMITNHIKEYKSIVNGDEPVVMGFNAESEQYKFIVNKIEELQNSNYKLPQICIVCATKEDCNKIQTVLTFADIKSTLLIDDIYEDTDGGVCICPINGVKGLEFEVVFIFNYNNIGKNRIKESDSNAVKVNYMKLIECEKYVASTRARSVLIITYMEEGEEN